jgi:hypothetical protein
MATNPATFAYSMKGYNVKPGRTTCGGRARDPQSIIVEQARTLRHRGCYSVADRVRPSPRGLEHLYRTMRECLTSPLYVQQNSRIQNTMLVFVDANRIQIDFLDLRIPRG